MKGYSPLPRDPDLEPYDQTQFSLYSFLYVSGGKSYLSTEDIVSNREGFKVQGHLRFG